jgi:hypothetical protein
MSFASDVRSCVDAEKPLHVFFSSLPGCEHARGHLLCISRSLFFLIEHSPYINIFGVAHSEGGIFNAKLIFSPMYPDRPPKMKFLTPIWHPNGKNAPRPSVGWCQHEPLDRKQIS